MTCVAVRSHHAASTAATVAAAIARSVFASVPVIGERLQLRIALDTLEILVGDEALRRRRLGEGAVRAHELADAGEPLVGFRRAARAIHDLQLLREIEH